MPGCTEMRLGNKIRVRGPIATYRRYKSKDKNLTFVTLGSGTGRYWDLVLDGSFRLHNFDMIDVEGEMGRFFESDYIKVSTIHGFKSLSRDWRIPEEVESHQRAFN